MWYGAGAAGPRMRLSRGSTGGVRSLWTRRRFRERLRPLSPVPVAAFGRPGPYPAAGGRGRSCGPGCAARSASSPAPRRCAAGRFPLAFSCRRSRKSGCSRRDRAFRLFLSCLAYPLVVGLGLGLHVVLEYTVQDHVVHLALVLVIGVVANAAAECGQRDGGGKLPVGVINLDNPHGSLGIRPLPCCTGGVQEFEFWSAAARWVVSKLKQGQITPPTGRFQQTL